MSSRESFTYVREINLLVGVAAASWKLEGTGSLVQAIIHRILEKTLDCLSLKVLKNVEAPFPFENGAEQYFFESVKRWVNFLRQARKLKNQIETISWTRGCEDTEFGIVDGDLMGHLSIRVLTCRNGVINWVNPEPELPDKSVVNRVETKDQPVYINVFFDFHVVVLKAFTVFLHCLHKGSLSSIWPDQVLELKFR